MSKSTNAAADAAKENTGSEDFTPITSQADLDRIVGARLAREKQKYADYETLREKAAKADKDAAELAEARVKIADYETLREKAVKADKDAAELAEARVKIADYETLREKAVKADKDAAELAEARVKIADYEAKAQHDTWVREAALEYEVPENLLRGDTMEDLKAHAASLQAALNKAAPKVPVLPDQGKAPDSSLSELQKAARQLFNRD